MNDFRILKEQINIDITSSDLAEELCRKIKDNLPKYFGLPDVNEHYAVDIPSHIINLAAKIDNSIY